MASRRTLPTVLIVALAAAVLVAPNASAQPPGNLTWQGGDGTSWNNGGNWFSLVTTRDPLIPEDGDVLNFGPGATDRTSVNDIEDLDLESIQIEGDGMVLTGNGVGIANTIRITTDGTATVDFPVTASEDMRIAVEEADGVLRLRTPAASAATVALALGNHTLTVQGPGTVEIWGDLTGVGNIVTSGGPTIVVARPLSFAGTLTLGDNATLRLDRDGSNCGSLPGATVSVGTGARLVVDCSASVGTLESSGEIALEGQQGALARLTIGGGTAGGALAGVLGGDETTAILCCDDGRSLRITGDDHTFAGTVEAHGGAVRIDGRLLTTVRANVTGGGVLGGHGRVGDTTVAAGVLDPGDEGGAGMLRTGALSLTEASTFRVLLIGANPGEGGHDQLAANGAVTLGGATLEVELGDGHTSEIGQQFTILRGATSLTGQFDGLDEGDVIEAGGLFFQLTYEGGEFGRDIVLTRVEGPGEPEPPVYRLYFTFLARDN
jgi:hypothetical protein